MVEQQLRREPSSRILIVSQANVAVDNALSGIVRSHKEVTVRCGNASKIGNALRETTLENHYDRYIKKVQLLQGKVDRGDNKENAGSLLSIVCEKRSQREQ